MPATGTMSYDIHEAIDPPIVHGPMAGGISTPALAAAVSNAGGLGFLAAGNTTASALRKEISATRALTARPFGVNLLVHNAPRVDQGAVARYRERLRAEARRYGAVVGDPMVPEPERWANQLAVVADARVPVVSFTFGCPDESIIAELKRNGCEVVVTITSAAEATRASQAGADVLCVQGAEAGGQRGTFVNAGLIDDTGLLPLLRSVLSAVDTPLIATGGLSHGRDIAAVLVAGARAAQLGTMFLPCRESGARTLYKRALTDAAHPATAVTRAFTGRAARALVNRFLLEHTDAAPAAYPHVHHLTKQIRHAAERAGDTQAMALWAGQGHRFAREMPAADLVRLLAEQARAAPREITQRWPTWSSR